MVDPSKKPKESGSGSQVFSSNVKLMWDKLAETYDKIDSSVIFNMHYKINTLLKLMQFVMGLDDIYASIRSTLLTTDPLPTVKEAFSLLSRDESHRNIHSGGSGVKSGSSAFVSKVDNKESIFFAANSTDNRKRFNNNNNNTVRNPSLVCKHCNMNSHTIERCFKLIGYPPNFKRKDNTGQNSNNVSVTGKATDPSGGGSHTLTSDQFETHELAMFFNLNTNIHTYSMFVGWIIDSGASQYMTFTTTFLFNIIDVSHLDITVAHPYGTKAKVNQIGSCKLNEKLIIHDVLVVPDYHNSLLSVSKLAKDSKLSVCFNEKDCVIQDSVLKSQWDWLGHPADQVLSVLKDDIDLKRDFSSSVVETVDAVQHPAADPSASTSKESFDNSGSKNITDVNSDKLGSINAHGPIDDGDNLLQTSEGSLDHSSVGRPQTYRRSVMPSKLNDYVIDSKVKYGINKYVDYLNFSSDNYSFVTNLSKTYEPMSYKEAASDPRWIDAMNSEMEALIRNMTWVITKLPSGRKRNESKWIFKVKYKSTGEVERFKARLVAKEYNQKERIDYAETFSTVMKMVTVRCVLSLAVQNGWTVYQLDINNAFLYGEIVEDVCIEVLSDNDKLCLCQRKYCLKLLNEFEMLVAKPSKVMHAPKQSDIKLAFKVFRYHKGSLEKGVSYVKSNFSSISAYVDSDWAKCTATRRSITGYAVYLGDSLISWKRKKQNVMTRSSAEAEFRAMCNVNCEVMWVLKILTELRVSYCTPVSVYCDSSAAIQIAVNPVFHEKTKHFEIDLYFLREKTADCVIKTCKVKTDENVADILTKGLSVDGHKKFCDTLHLVDSFQV
uniref:Uncharacterized protein n=1 Tax=Tanacetum cinerariifolium TaxID=118510 RepID=A0A6L2NF37_TANCI|nr:hypothetical protein [Tanacetum cinerariifolium]